MAQTLSAGLLQKAAEQKNDEDILVHIRGKDCVAIEARYHNRCYKNYTRCLWKKTEQLTEPSLYDEAFDRFCEEIVQKRIIDQEEILLLSYLLKKFVDYLKDLNDTAVVPYQASRLKKRIASRYPQVSFHASRTMNKGTLVYADSISPGHVADNLMEFECDSSDGEPQEEEESFIQNIDDRYDCSSRQLFHSAMEIRNLLKESKGVVDWPPDSNDLTVDNAKQAIPTKLFNFVAWAVGYSDEPLDDERVNISGSESCKIVSICQDLVYAHGKGRKQTHKSLALAMTVRQLTGSEKIVNILHGLGHSVSSSTVYKHDSALAEINIKSEEVVIPRNIGVRSFTTIVWDNNDFNEQTLTGKGTTHFANGIIIQKDDSRLGDKINVSKKVRTIKAPETSIQPYTSKAKGQPSVRQHVANMDLGYEQHCMVHSHGMCADFAYIVYRLRASTSQEVVPGWTGLNSRLATCVPVVSKIGYLPIIDAAISDMSTVNEVLKRSVSISQRLEIPEIVLVFDEAVYSKAQMIRWKDQDYTNRLVIRLGEFHIIMSYCSAIGKIFKDAGLQVSFIH